MPSRALPRRAAPSRAVPRPALPGSARPHRALLAKPRPAMPRLAMPRPGLAGQAVRYHRESWDLPSLLIYRGNDFVIPLRFLRRSGIGIGNDPSGDSASTDCRLPEGVCGRRSSFMPWLLICQPRAIACCSPCGSGIQLSCVSLCVQVQAPGFLSAGWECPRHWAACWHAVRSKPAKIRAVSISLMRRGPRPHVPQLSAGIDFQYVGYCLRRFVQRAVGPGQGEPRVPAHDGRQARRRAVRADLPVVAGARLIHDCPAAR